MKKITIIVIAVLMIVVLSATILVLNWNPKVNVLKKGVGGCGFESSFKTLEECQRNCEK